MACDLISRLPVLSDAVEIEVLFCEMHQFLDRIAKDDIFQYSESFGL